MEIRHRGVFVSMGVQFLRKRVHRSHFLLKLRFFAKKKRLYFGTTFSFCVDGVLERARLHRASDGYDGVLRRRRVSIPVYAFCAVLLFCVDWVAESSLPPLLVQWI